MPEPQIDFSTLNLGGNNWNMQGMGMNNSFQPQVFAVLEVPEEPVNVAALSGKGEETIEEEQESSFETCKYDCPTEIETPEVAKDMPVIEAKEIETTEATSSQFDEQDPSFTLYATASNSSASTSTTLEDAITILSQLPSEKSSQFELYTESATDSVLEKNCAKLDASCRRLDALFSSFGLRSLL